MKVKEIPVPEVYKESADFRFFLNWFDAALSQIKYDTENLLDLYDPQRCPSSLLWLLGATMGYKFDDRMPVAYNRLVLLYFMSMIHTKGSKNGVTLAAEVNLAQFNIEEYGKEKEILYDRLEDTSIPVNATYVTSNTSKGYIDVVYFSSKLPVDTCIEYVRPIGMYCFQHAGVRVDARTKLSIDARLTNAKEYGVSIGPTHTAHYRRSDYASMQQMDSEYKYIDKDSTGRLVDVSVNSEHSRNKAYYRNSDAEGSPSPYVNPGYRTLYSLQLCNNEHIVKSLIPEADNPENLVEPEPIFSLGYGPQDVTLFAADILSTLEPGVNLLYDREMEESITDDVYTVDANRTHSVTKPGPAVNPIMSTLGDAITVHPEKNTLYSSADASGKITGKQKNRKN